MRFRSQVVMHVRRNLRSSISSHPRSPFTPAIQFGHQARQMKQLQEENLRLKQLVAELALNKAMLQDVLSKK
jgi:hypothetical protein